LRNFQRPLFKISTQRAPRLGKTFFTEPAGQ